MIGKLLIPRDSRHSGGWEYHLITLQAAEHECARVDSCAFVNNNLMSSRFFVQEEQTFPASLNSIPANDLFDGYMLL
ncbi:uncharacterized protein N7503_002481 [Penicillium pulvis]|uniref:uncharacterized protein n=1 Tax=Penicillium pulvis TaxID=1562058 RepID=UPI002548D89E|nr:uncharacterized protein N7503_002481 [Penicillium pulvis]KAJ5810263.1 hypothetical protein N7503_002481 [Penicillium pulvis]